MRLLLLTWFTLASLLAAAQASRTPRSTKPARPTSRTATARKPAQPARPAVVYKDLLYKLDQSSQPVKISELTDGSVIYLIQSAPGVRQTIDRSQVWKVAFSDGSEEIITPLRTAAPPSTTVAVAATPSAPATNRAQDNTNSSATGAARYRSAKPFGRLNVTVGPEGFLFALGKNSRWTNDLSGLGMSQTVGASLRVDYRFIKAVALSVTGGYTRWQLIRNYNLAGVERYDETIELTRIPVLVGVKLYAGNLYILPEGGASLMTERTSTSGAHPKPTSSQSSSTPISYGGSLGYEFHVGSLLIDVSGRYQILDVKDLNVGAVTPVLTEKIQFASLRVGLGFTALRN